MYKVHMLDISIKIYTQIDGHLNVTMQSLQWHIMQVLVDFGVMLCVMLKLVQKVSHMILMVLKFQLLNQVWQMLNVQLLHIMRHIQISMMVMDLVIFVHLVMVIQLSSSTVLVLKKVIHLQKNMVILSS